MNISHKQIHEKSELVFFLKNIYGTFSFNSYYPLFALGRMKGGVKCGATKWFWIHDPLTGYPEP